MPMRCSRRGVGVLELDRGLLMAFEVWSRGQHDARSGKRLAGPAQHLDAFDQGAARWSLQAIAASDDRQRQADAPGAMRRKRCVSQRAPERERADRKPSRLSGKGQLACFARLHADDRDLFGA
jgi:hypothetical protein